MTSGRASRVRGVMSITREIIYSGNNMEGKTTTELNTMGEPAMQMTTSMKGRYSGACNK